MTYKEVYLNLTEHNVPSAITFHDSSDSVVIMYNDMVIIRETGDTNDCWARVIRFLMLGGFQKTMELHDKHFPGEIENSVPLKETILTPTEKIRQNYKPENAPPETGQPIIERPITKNPL